MTVLEKYRVNNDKYAPMNYILNLMLILGACKMMIGEPFFKRIEECWQQAEVLNYYMET